MAARSAAHAASWVSARSGRGQPEPVRLVLDEHAPDPERASQGVQAVQRCGPVAGQRAVELGHDGARGWHHLLRGEARVDHHPRRGRGVGAGGHRQKRLAATVSALAQAMVPGRLTHSTWAWAPSPSGPNRTVGMPAPAMNAESAQ